MANRPLAYTLSERKATVGALAGKTVIQANPTGRKRIDHRTFFEEVARHHLRRCGGGSRAAPRRRSGQETC